MNQGHEPRGRFFWLLPQNKVVMLSQKNRPLGSPWLRSIYLVIMELDFAQNIGAEE